MDTYKKQKPDNLLDLLAGKDRRSIGRVNQVVQIVLESPSRFQEVFDGIMHDDPVIRMRAADAVEKITAKHPEYLYPYKNKLIQEISQINQKEVRWHVAAMFSRLNLTSEDRRAVLDIIEVYLKDKSKIVKTFSMQCLAGLALQDNSLLPAITKKLEQLTQTGSPAMKSRGRKLLAKLKVANRNR